MPDLIILCALDSFGAEALAKVRSLDSLVASDERILWAWGGDGDRPLPPGWPPREPFWSLDDDAAKLSFAHPRSVDETFDRRAYFEAIVASAARHLSEWNRKLDAQTRRSDERLVHLFFVGSLADPRSALRAQACFQAYSKNSALWGGWRMGGVWALGRNTASLPFNEGLADASTAVSLRDLATSLATIGQEHAGRWLPLLPQFIAGNGARLADPLPSRLDAALLCAMGLLGRVHGARGRLQGDSPFLTQHEADTIAYWAAQTPFNPAQPLAALGASVVVKRHSLLLEAFATFTILSHLEQFQQQDAPEANWGPLPTHAPQLAEQLEHWMAAALSEISGRLAERGFTQEAASSFPFGAEAVQATIGWEAFYRRFRARIEQAFGWESFASLPLESWDQSLQELQGVAERFFLADRQRFLHQFEGAFVESLDRTVRARLDAISLGASLPDAPCPFQPHLAARRFVAQLESELRRQKQADEQARRKERHTLCPDDELPKVEREVQRLYSRLRRAVREVPSPLAILARIVTVFVVALFCFGLLDFPPYASYPPEQVRMLKLIPAGLFSLGLGGYLIFKCRRLKADLRKTFARWFSRQLEFYRERNLRLALVARDELYQLAIDYFRWLALVPGEKALPTFVEFCHLARERSHHWPLGSGPLAASEVQRFLHNYPADLRHAHAAWRTQLIRVINRFTECSREFILPYIPRDEDGLLKLRQLVKEVLPGLEGRPAEIRAELSAIVARIQTSPSLAPELPALPGQEAARRRRGAAAEWRGSFTFLPHPDADGGEPARRIVETFVEDFRQHVAKLDRSLRQWILDDLYGEQSWSDIRDMHPPTWHLIDRAKLPPLAPPRDQPTPLAEIWMPAEDHFSQSFDPSKRAARYIMQLDADPHRAFYALLALHHSLTADDVIYGTGGSGDPDNLLGKHWAEHVKATLPHAILQPLSHP